MGWRTFDGIKLSPIFHKQNSERNTFGFYAKEKF